MFHMNVAQNLSSPKQVSGFSWPGQCSTARDTTVPCRHFYLAPRSLCLLCWGLIDGRGWVKKHYVLLSYSFLLVLPPSFTYKSLPFIITGPEGGTTLPPNHPGLPTQRQSVCVLCFCCGGVQRGGEEERVTGKRFSDR